ncbi:MAG: hypothetical protein FJ360_01600 [Thaumarchaeota archaeon]|nr:hypothetical protein [Nitrososphaerota archaeon]
MPDLPFNDESIWLTSKLKLTSSLTGFSFSDGNDRQEIWKILFGDKPMPSTVEDAVESNFGILDNEIKENIAEPDFESLFKDRTSYNDDK